MDQFGNNVEAVGGPNGLDLPLSAPNLGALFSILESIMVVTSPGDEDYELEIELESATNPGATQTLTVPVIVSPMATVPVLDAPDALSVDSAGQVVVPIRILAPGADDSEVLSLQLQVGRDSNGILLGALERAPGVSVPGVSLTSLGNGVYTVTSSLNTAALREAALNLFLLNGLVFRPNGQSEGLFPQGISLTATVTETAGKLSI